MKLKSIKIEGFRKHYSTEVICEDTTFLIGPNNAGKSSVLKAIKYLLEDIKKIDDSDFCCFINNNNEVDRLTDKVIITAEFNHLTTDALNWRGFNSHRLFKNEDFEKEGYSFYYRKTFDSSGCKIEMKQKSLTLKEDYKDCKSIKDFIDNGVDKSVFENSFNIININKKNKKISIPEWKKLEEEGSEIIFDITDSIEWFENPGGIPQNVSSRLPKFLLIKDQSQNEELSGKNGSLMTTLNQLFEDIREESENFKNAQYYLNELAQELDPQDENSDFSNLLKELNNVVSDIFPNSSFIAKANLSNANDVIKPNFDVQLGSNIYTSINNQGAGVVRSAIFAMLRYRNMRENKRKQKDEYIRPLLIAFEEPEIYLHPQAAKQMKETIYSLSLQENNQIICTTHSPYMIDLSKNTNQILNSFNLEEKPNPLNENGDNNEPNIEQVIINPFNISSKFKNLTDEDKTYVKMILKMDDSIAKIFFTKNVLIIEGDTEELVFKETILRMPEHMQKEFSYNWEIIKARGKAAIIPLVNYLKSMGIKTYVMHDRDANTPGATKFNEPISKALNDDAKLYLLEECIEDMLGYNPPSNEKPYNAYRFINENWKDSWDDVTESWKRIINSLYNQS
ncbi:MULTISPECIES: ATP-dependent nuclease [Staphylococcus]|uniref:ATP-dependent nuclease n=1 Tax=Staphylococcus TaxID=1279 RepID=UPI001865CF87|nr:MULTISPECIES: AAA family ATPase [Staphylococcus]